LFFNEGVIYARVFELLLKIYCFLTRVPFYEGVVYEGVVYEFLLMMCCFLWGCSVWGCSVWVSPYDVLFFMRV